MCCGMQLQGRISLNNTTMEIQFAAPFTLPDTHCLHSIYAKNAKEFAFTPHGPTRFHLTQKRRYHLRHEGHVLPPPTTTIRKFVSVHLQNRGDALLTNFKPPTPFTITFILPKLLLILTFQLNASIYQNSSVTPPYTGYADCSIRTV